MATDIRESILLRLLAIIGAVEGVKAVARNAQDVKDLARPGIVMHDGHEELNESVGRPDLRGRLQMQIMSPQICVYFSTATNDVGPVANSYRMRVLAAIFNDAQLKGFLFDEEIRYQGCTLVPPEVTESRETRLEIEVAFTYPFRVSDFTS